MIAFTDQNLLTTLRSLDDRELDELPFGVIGFDERTLVRRYNRLEEEMSGYRRENILNRPLFLEIAPCMNNYLVALKFEQQPELDETLPYILSFKVKPVKVDLRLLKNGLAELHYVLIRR